MTHQLRERRRPVAMVREARRFKAALLAAAVPVCLWCAPARASEGPPSPAVAVGPASASPEDFAAARAGFRAAVSARMGMLGPQLSPHIDGRQFGFHGFNLSLEAPIASRFRMGIELELVGLANDLVLEHAGALSGAAVSGVLTGLAAQGSLGVLQLRRFDLDAQLLLGLVSAGVADTNFKVTAAAPALPDASYNAGAVARVTARLAGYFWLSGFEYQRRSNAIGLFTSLGLDSHWLWVEASGNQPVSALHNELAVQLGVALSGAP